MSTENLNLMLAGLIVLLAIIAVVIAWGTLRYMRSHDLKIETRNGWIELHKSMVNLQVHRKIALIQIMEPEAHPGGAGLGLNVDLQKPFSLAAAQLRGQLDRLNEDPLIVEIAQFLDEKEPLARWQMPGYGARLEALSDNVAQKCRPK
jgi:hypothetical protein